MTTPQPPPAAHLNGEPPHLNHANSTPILPSGQTATWKKTLAKPTPEEEVALKKRWRGAEPTVNNFRVIAIDFDDVIAQTNPAVITHHNERYKTDLTIDDFVSYYPFRNRGFGSQLEIHSKWKLLFGEGPANVLHDCPPLPNLAAALQRLVDIGHVLHIVTARGEDSRDIIDDWLVRHRVRHYFTQLHFVGSFVAFDDHLAEAVKSLKDPKLEDGSPDLEMRERQDMQIKSAFKRNMRKSGKELVLQKIGASLLIDDHYGNVAPLTELKKPIDSLLFGHYPWNRKIWALDTPVNNMTHEERIKAGFENHLETLEEVEHDRAGNWIEVVEWVEKWDLEYEKAPKDKKEDEEEKEEEGKGCDVQ